MCFFQIFQCIFIYFYLVVLFFCFIFVQSKDKTMAKSTKGTFVKLVMVTDPETGGEVGIEIYKLSTKSDIISFVLNIKVV